MTAKEYLSQMHNINRMIDVKLEEAQQLRLLAEKATSVMSMSTSTPSGTRNVHRMEDTIVKMVDLENEIAADIERLLVTKQDIEKTIDKVGNVTYQLVLRHHYLCCKDWDDIAEELNYHRKYALQMHKQALDCVDALKFAIKREELPPPIPSNTLKRWRKAERTTGITLCRFVIRVIRGFMRERATILLFKKLLQKFIWLHECNRRIYKIFSVSGDDVVCL
jgi:hypothetical protein